MAGNQSNREQRDDSNIEKQHLRSSGPAAWPISTGKTADGKGDHGKNARSEYSGKTKGDSANDVCLSEIGPVTEYCRTSNICAVGCSRKPLA